MSRHNWLNAKCEARETATGRGVFAKAPIARGEYVSVFGGDVIPIQDEPVFSDGRGDYSLQIDERFVIGPRTEADLEDADFFNHSCEPNAGFHGQIILVALRDIAAGEQIVFDYAMCLHPGEGPEYGFDCRCGAGTCRGRVTNDDWRIPELQRRYRGYFQWYLQSKIDGMRAPGF